MKINIKNLSNKQRSIKAKNDLQLFTKDAVIKMNLENDINEIRIIYKKEFYNFYKKNQQFLGFKKLYNNKIVTIILARNWDMSQEVRKSAIIHELTHVKQIATKKIILNKDFSDIKYKGKVFPMWKNYSNKKFNTLEKKDYSIARRYFEKHFPWEREVDKNVQKYNLD